MGKYGFKINNRHTTGVCQSSLGLVRNQEETCRTNLQGDANIGQANGAYQFGSDHIEGSQSNYHGVELEASELLQRHGRSESKAGYHRRRTARNIHIRYYNPDQCH